ncbi:hypothetical protein BTO20_21990 [Mycobacterium dioxanotrophicus]|uniref:Uncharacterized protein n=1 Tax=Mycobacterium dioxanotrophicus TaxID=482462 RepID=A0A1Y0C6K0_9MYCO|nr:hypothetical protein BTO20_21990 [Mycobacterium dioxanotrophicus]
MVLSAIAIVPSAPVLVPELMGAAAAELTDLRAAVVAAAQTLPARWVAVGVGDTDTVIGPEGAGTFAGYGVDVAVALGPGGPHPPTELPLSALVAGWIRGHASPGAAAEMRVYADSHSADAAQARGRRLRALIDDAVDPVGVLVVADGASTLTSSAPGGYDPESGAIQSALDAALAAGDAAALLRLPESIVGRVAYQVLAGLTEPAPAGSRELYRGAPYGVGYFAGVWQP